MISFIVLSILSLTFAFDLWLSILNYRNRTAPIPTLISDVYDTATYRNWLNYNMENNRLSFISKIINFLITFSLLTFGFFPFINHFTVRLSDSIYLQTLLFLGIYFIIDYTIGIFFSYYQQFIIEERYGFNKSTMKTFITDKIKGLLLTVILGGGFIFLLTILYYKVDDLFYLLTFITIFIIIIFINLFYVKLFVPLFNKLSPLEDGELKNKIINFANQVGYEISKISIIDSSKRSTKLNAFFSGFGKYKQVVLYDTLVNKMNDEQILSVLAHEIGHSKNNHILKNLVISLVTISIYLFVLIYTVNSSELSMAFHFSQVNFGFGLILFSILISPISIIIEAITSRISRKFEYEADYFASVHGFKKEMEESLKILARENFSNLTPHPLYVSMRYSHPPISDRIKAIRQIKENYNKKI